MKFYRVRDWDKHFENNRTRELRKLDWVPIPNKQDGDGYRTIMSHDRALEVFGCWVLILQIASKCSPRGVLIRDSGQPHSATSLSRITGAPEESFTVALEYLSSDDVGWIEVIEEPDFDTASPGDIKRAHGRVNRALESGRDIHTPLGRITVRPSACQWCDAPEKKGAGGHPGIVAHHPCGYGNERSDYTVIFVCRSCHGFFESGKFTTGDILRRYGSTWMPAGDESHNGGGESHSDGSASHHSANERLRNGTERNGREENIPIDRATDRNFSGEEVERIREECRRIAEHVPTVKSAKHDRTLVLLAATLRVRRLVDVEVIDRAVDAVADAVPKPRKPVAYFRKCLLGQCEARGISFPHLEAITALPEALHHRGRDPTPAMSD